MDAITRRHVLAKLGSSAEQELDTWSVSGTTPSDAQVFPTAVEGFAQGFAVMMIAFAIVMVLVGIIVVILGNVADRKKVKTSEPASA